VQLPSLREHERSYMRRVLLLCGGDVTLCARVLGIGRATLYRKIQSMEGIETRGERLERQRNERARQLEAFLFTGGSRGNR
jgi:DNA invertase Pin-like site-specific DNA recombinase